jgi:hypothetical protein
VDGPIRSGHDTRGCGRSAGPYVSACEAARLPCPIRAEPWRPCHSFAIFVGHQASSQYGSQRVHWDLYINSVHFRPVWQIWADFIVFLHRIYGFFAMRLVKVLRIRMNFLTHSSRLP